VARNARYGVTLTATLGLAVTLIITSTGFAPAYQNRALHVAKETAGGLVLLLVAALLAGRFSRKGTLQDLLALAGVLVLAIKNLVFSAITAIVTETSAGLTTWRTTGAGMVGRRPAGRRRPWPRAARPQQAQGDPAYRGRLRRGFRCALGPSRHLPIPGGVHGTTRNRSRASPPKPARGAGRRRRRSDDPVPARRRRLCADRRAGG
jgi:hypothetical protein